MTRNINYKDTLFNQANHTSIRGKPTFETLHKLRNEIKANANSVYSNLGGGSHGHLILVLTDAQYALISPTPFIYPTRPVPLIVPDSTTAPTNSNIQTIQTIHTDRVRLFREVTGVEQALVQKILPRSRKRTLRISATARPILSMIPPRICWLASKTTTVNWYPTSSLSAKTLSRRQSTILDTQ